MTPAEIAETLINGNVADARDAIVEHDPYPNAGIAAAVLALDVLTEMADDDWRDGGTTAVFATIARLRRCLTGGT